jgi:hypothetical protein
MMDNTQLIAALDEATAARIRDLGLKVIDDLKDEPILTVIAALMTANLVLIQTFENDPVAHELAGLLERQAGQIRALRGAVGGHA